MHTTYASALTTVGPTATSSLIPHATLLVGKALEAVTEAVTTTMQTPIYSTMNNIDPSMMSSQQQVAVPMDSGNSIVFIEALNHLSPAGFKDLTHALLASFSVILVSELGDKTFIITAIMAMKNSRFVVFLASAMALLAMTILSVGMGVAVTVIPEIYTHYGSIVLFLCFGIKMLKESYDMDENGEESEFDEVQRSLEDGEKEEGRAGDVLGPGQDVAALKDPNKKDDLDAKMLIKTNWFHRFKKTISVAPLLIKVFTMIFLAEWGDRSQISTIILAAREDVVGVFIGSFGGHILCTGMAVVGGRFVADMISVKTRK